MLTLTAVLFPSPLDARRGIVRLHPTVLASLGIAVWDTVLLTGRRTTGALAAIAPDDSSTISLPRRRNAAISPAQRATAA